MLTVRYKYPDDPETTAVLMFGAEFVEHFRGGQPAQMIVNGEVVSEFTEVICDLCNELITAYQPCMLIGSWLCCWDCAEPKQEHIVR